MSYGYWSNGRKDRGFSEKAFQRQSLDVWDARWHALSVPARQYFLKEVKPPAKKEVIYTRKPSAPPSNFPPEVLAELIAAGFVEIIVDSRSKQSEDRVVVRDDIHDFAVRIRALYRYQLLTTNQPGNIEKYVDAAFYGHDLVPVVIEVLRKSEIDDIPSIDEAIALYVKHRHWPEWVAQTLKDPVAERILGAIRDADGPILLSDLAGRLPKDDPNEVRKAVDRLFSHLALFEDLQPDTWDLIIGFLPAVIEDARRASRPAPRPPLVVVEEPRELGPDGSVSINDLRALLLEAVSEPPRLRQDHTFFQKECERFKAALEPLPPWLLQALSWNDEGRPDRALSWARTLGLVHEVPDGKEIRLKVTPSGAKWLSGGIDSQYEAAYKTMMPLPSPHKIYNSKSYFTIGHADPYNSYRAGDAWFLGEPVTVITKGKNTRPYWESKPEDYEAVRKAVDKAFSALEPGVFYRFDSVVSHLTHAESNPLNLGLAPNQTVVFWGAKPVPPLEEAREEAGRILIETFVRLRLLPLGCLRAAVDAQGQLAIARQARYDAYFGRKISPSELDSAATRVVVQPDFSVIVIGPNAAPTADLAPFCERTTQGGSQGAMLLKITRESVIKAVSQGLKPAEILERLERHAGNAVPPNVLREVRDWSQWARHVTVDTLTVLRCPDRETADRVMGALKRQAERVNDTLIAIDQKTITATERNKLREHGILIQGHLEDPTQKKPKKKARRRW